MGVTIPGYSNVVFATVRDLEEADARMRAELTRAIIAAATGEDIGIRIRAEIDRAAREAAGTLAVPPFTEPHQTWRFEVMADGTIARIRVH